MEFEALFGALGALGGLFGGGSQQAQIEASVQNQKLQSATDRLNQAVAANVETGEKRLETVQQSAAAQNVALDRIVAALRDSLLRDLRL